MLFMPRGIVERIAPHANQRVTRSTCARKYAAAVQRGFGHTQNVSSRKENRTSSLCNMNKKMPMRHMYPPTAGGSLWI